MKIDKDFFKNINFTFHVDVSNVEKAYNPIMFSKAYWLQDTFFKWTEEEIDNAVDSYIGTKYGIDCYVSYNLIAVSK